MLYDKSKPLTLEAIQADPKLHEDLLNLAKRRYFASADYVRPWHERWVRLYKIYRSIVDAVDDPDEVNYMVSYAFGIVEDLVSRISEPILQMRPPCRVAAKQIGHEQQADNFASIATNYFQSSRYQLEWTESVREMIITGNSWEVDGWASDYAEGRVWAKVPRIAVVDKIKSWLSDKVYNTPMAAPYESLEEVPFSVPLKVGYFTRFPWAFDIYPEPGVRNVRDMHWLLEQERSVAVEDLTRKTYIDPVTKQRVGLFDFSKMLADVGAHEPGSIKPMPIDLKHDYGKEAQDAMAGVETERTQWSQLDMDRVSILWCWEPNRVYAIANGKYIVAYRENVFQVPRIPYRLKIYTPQKEFLFGMGALEPIESQLYELSDIHKLSMRNWVRIINRMVAYNEDAIPYPDDWKSRAGGKIRVRPGVGGSVANEIHSIDMPDITQSMLAQESNTKGSIERTISLADFSPGVDGTKQMHKTLGGLMEIQKNLAQRATTVRRMVLSSVQDQMWFMEKLYSQFQLEPQPFTVYGPDGSTRLSRFDLWDIYTGGLGFDFVIEYDPSFGDDAVMRNQMMVLFDQALKYENARVQLQRSDLPRVDLGDVMRRSFKAFGWSDTSKILAPASGELDPMTEFNMMLAGQPCAPNPEEDLVKHLIEHSIQRSSPKFRQGLADGSIDPRVGMMLDAHIKATMMLIDAVLQNPNAAAQEKIREAMAQAGAAGQRAPLPGQAGGNPQLSAGSLNGGMDGLGATVPNTRTPTPRDSGMAQA